MYGITGYAGTELMRLISTHPGFELVFAQSSSADGSRVGDIFPLLPRGGDVKVSREPEVENADIVFLSLPTGGSMQVVPSLLGKGIRVVDLGADYRLSPASLFESVYGIKHMDEENLELSTYGVTEIGRGRIGESALVANPGCYPTAALIALFPVADLIGGGVIIDAKSGTSGSGREPTQFNNHSEIGQNVRPYNPDRHRHKQEITSLLSQRGLDASAVTFVPHLVPLVRGIEESIYLPGTDSAAVLERLTSFYSGSKFVHVVKEASINMVLGTNNCVLQVEPTGNGTVIFAYIDNLLKGASGQAVQNANVMMGLPEESGLLLAGSGVGR